jgi:quinol-cytochrome oxidoreductase complex cytochrome b subunit/mono/diheme cytochrome c family protein
VSNKIADWFDERTGYRALLSHALDEEIAGGARWAYVFGSGLLTVFICQVVTGLLLMATYTPSMTGAWSSVFYIQHKVADGWFVRGLHHYGAQAMIVVLGMHLLQVALYGAYKKPREVTWWLGLALLGAVQGLGLTGYLLPWDQKGYWATKVATNIAGTLPVIGPAIQTLIVGGTEYGQATLTRFYVLHVGVLPAVLLMVVGMHVAMFRRFGATPPAGADLNKKDRFHPDQLARDVAFAVLVVLAMAVLTSVNHGAHLDAPADPTVDYKPRPEWYFLFLFQLLKYLPGSLELLGTVVLPGLAGAFLFVLPFLDRGESKRARDRLPFLAPVLLGACGVVFLTAQSLQQDAHDAEYQRGLEVSHQRAQRAIMLAQKGIPVGGPLELLRGDPMTRGADVDAQHCTKCHVLAGEGERDAPDHTGFGSREWILGVAHNPGDDHYFGKTKIDDMKPMGKLGDEKLAAVAEFLFSLGHEPQDPPFDATLAAKGKSIFLDKCLDCHVYEGEGANVLDGPDMTGYGSRTWIYRQIKDGSVHYGDLNKMPKFDDDLDEHDLQMVTAFLRQQRFAKIDFKVEPAKERPEDKAEGKTGGGEE